MSDVNYGISNVSTVMTSCAGSQHQLRPYTIKLERVRFGEPLDKVCKPDLPGPLLLMLLKINKEGPFRKEIFRASGNHQSMRKLIHFLQVGRLVNIENYHINTIASVLKKFLRKIPDGIFGPENEAALFDMIKMDDPDEQMKAVSRLIMSLPVYSQHLLVLLFGTFKIIAANSKEQQTNMTAEALGVSVAPSFFHTCATAGKTAKFEDVERYKHATKVTSFFIEHFGMRDLFGRDNYQYYAKLTGRILRVEDEWIFFTYPLEFLGVRSDLDLDTRPRSSHHEMEPTGSLEMIPENCPLDPAGRLSISLDTDCIATTPSPSMDSGHRSHTLDIRSKRGSNNIPISDPRHNTLDHKSFSCLPQVQVHQRQTERMRARSDWFLSMMYSDPSGLVTYRFKEKLASSPRPTSLGPQVVTSTVSIPTNVMPYSSTGGLLEQPESLTPVPPVISKPPDGQNQCVGAVANVALRRRLSDKDKERRLVRRSSSKRKDKENGGADKSGSQTGPALKRQSSSDSNGHSVHPALSRAASQDSPKGRLSRGGSFDQDSPGVCGGLVTPPAASEGGSVTSRTLPRI